MNRPRNRQPRSQKRQNGQPDRPPQNRPTASFSMPTVREVIPSASVSIVLKKDQTSGEEVQGIVQDVLTRGNHPRGIKVRLTDGGVGRVQRMVAGSQGTIQNPCRVDAYYETSSRQRRASPDAMPPPRTLADYIPDHHPDAADSTGHNSREGPADVRPNSVALPPVKCPICDDFEGDEIAVSWHVEHHVT